MNWNGWVTSLTLTRQAAKGWNTAVTERGLPFSRTAPHIRGRVFKRGSTWYMQVLNTNTNAVLASDNTNSYEVMANEAAYATAAARGAWTYNFKQKALS